MFFNSFLVAEASSKHVDCNILRFGARIRQSVHLSTNPYSMGCFRAVCLFVLLLFFLGCPKPKVRNLEKGKTVKYFLLTFK